MISIIISVVFMLVIIISIIVLYFVGIRSEFNAINIFDVVQEEEVNNTIRNLKSFMQRTAVNFDIRDSSISNINALNSSQDSSITKLNNQSSSLSSSVNALNNQSSSLSSSVNALDNKNSLLSSSINTLNNQNSSLHVEVEELTKYLKVNKKTESLDIAKNINMINMAGQSMNIAGGLNFANVNDPSNPSYSFELIPSTGEMKMNMASPVASTNSSASINPVQFGIYQNNKPLSIIDSGGKTNYFGNITMSNDACFEMGTGASKDRDAGKMCYQYLSPYDSLDIVGAGTQSTGRKIALHDLVTVDAIETLSIKLGNFKFFENKSDGSLQVTKLSNGVSITLFPSLNSS